mgnify:CR=1 FL=1
MKKAFTMIELVFVIVVIGILAAVIIPRSRTNPLYEAATQLVSHIRYTQHLAMVDDKFDSTTGSEWYMKRWQILFSNANSTLSYIIFSDYYNKDGNPNASSAYSEVAKDPSNSGKYLIGTEYSSFFSDSSDSLNKKLDLKNSYGITNVDLSSECTYSTSQKIAFDHLGRPLKGALNTYASAYPASTRMISSRCRITLSNSDGNVTIAIEPETGYAHIL